MAKVITKEELEAFAKKNSHVEEKEKKKDNCHIF